MKATWIILALGLFLALTTEPFGAEPGLTLDSRNAVPGQTVLLNLRLSGGQELYAGANARVILPAGIALKKITGGQLLSSGQFAVDYRTVSEEAISHTIVIVYSGTDAFSSTSGILLTLEVGVDAEIDPGSYEITFESSAPAVFISAKPPVEISALPPIPVNVAHAISTPVLADGKAYSRTHNTAGGYFEIWSPLDSDNDGLPDAWERYYFGNLDRDGKSDWDNDGLLDEEEFENATDPKEFDTDGDGIPDGWEVLYDLDPYRNDADDDPDEDGYSSLKEYKGRSNPNDWDSIPVGASPWIPLLLLNE
jgi:hypothetical protein